MTYFVIKIYSFACDQPGCDAVEEIQPDSAAAGGRPLIGEARRALKDMGWKARGQQLLCPAHAVDSHEGARA